jgi:hypothetical protein
MYTRVRHRSDSFLSSVDVRRSSRIKSMMEKDFVRCSTVRHDNDDRLNSMDETRIVADGRSSLPSKSLPPTRQTSQTIYNSVKIFLPNIGLKASTLLRTATIPKVSRSKKFNVAISSSSSSSDDDEWSVSFFCPSSFSVYQHCTTQSYFICLLNQWINYEFQNRSWNWFLLEYSTMISIVFVRCQTSINTLIQ